MKYEEMHDKESIKRFSALMPSVSPSDTSASESWSRIQKCIYQNALKSFGKNKHTNKDWFEKKINVLLPLLKIKQYFTLIINMTQVSWVKKDFVKL